MPSYFPQVQTAKLSGYLKVIVDLTNATWNTMASHEVAVITGAVHVVMLVECTSTLTDAADTATMSLGIEGDTDAIIGVTNVAGAGGSTLNAGQAWCDTTPTEVIGPSTTILLDRVIMNGLDLGYEIGTAALTGGALNFYIWWEPLNDTGSLTVGAGGSL